MPVVDLMIDASFMYTCTYTAMKTVIQVPTFCISGYLRSTSATFWDSTANHLRRWRSALHTTATRA